MALRTEIARLEQALGDGEARAATLRAEIAARPAPLDDAARSALLAERDAASATITAARADAAAICTPDTAGTLPDVAAYRDDAAVRSLVAEREALREELAREMLARPLGNPRLAEIVARLGAIQVALAAEGERIAARLEADADRAAARLDEIEARLRDSELAAAAVRALDEVVEKIAADRASLDAALNRQAALGQGTALPTSVRVLAEATVPTAPHWPDVAFLAGLAFVAALAAGIVVVVLRDILSGRAFRRRPFAPLAEMEPPVAAAGRMRRVDGDETQRAGPAEPTIAPLAGAETSLREVADSIAGRRRIIVTLAEELDIEGRPLAAVALVRALSGRDRTVILVDLQSDGANESAMGEIAELSGFTDLLAGDASFSQAIFRDRRSRAHFIPLGSRPLEPEQLAGERLATLLTALDHTYDHVVIDCPDEAIARMAPPADVVLGGERLRQRRPAHRPRRVAGRAGVRRLCLPPAGRAEPPAAGDGARCLGPPFGFLHPPDHGPGRDDPEQAEDGEEDRLAQRRGALEADGGNGHHNEAIERHEDGDEDRADQLAWRVWRISPCPSARDGVSPVAAGARGLYRCPVEHKP